MSNGLKEAYVKDGASLLPQFAPTCRACAVIITIFSNREREWPLLIFTDDRAEGISNHMHECRPQDQWSPAESSTGTVWMT